MHRTKGTVLPLALLLLAWLVLSLVSAESSSCETPNNNSKTTSSSLARRLLQCGVADVHPVVVLPPSHLTRVLNLSSKAGVEESRRFTWTIGKYRENRVIYDQPLFGGTRTWHVGIDLGGPALTAVHAFADGVIIHAGNNPARGDYGPTLVAEHRLRCIPHHRHSGDVREGADHNAETIVVYALYGHLSLATLELSRIGRTFKQGDVLGWLGTEDVNGGWPPHVHFQLARDRPVTHDLPGAVAEKDLEEAMEVYPDPRLVLGPIYED